MCYLGHINNSDADDDDDDDGRTYKFSDLCKLFVNYSRLNVRKHFFAERVVSVWNNLECDIINFSSLRSFSH